MLLILLNSILELNYLISCWLCLPYSNTTVIYEEPMAAFLHMPGEELLMIYDSMDPDSVR